MTGESGKQAASPGRFEEAGQEWRELSQEREQLFGASHPDTVDARENHAAMQAMLDQARKHKPSRAASAASSSVRAHN